jgi:phosphatidylinositol alpha-1,6-mannosyltransferase
MLLTVGRLDITEQQKGMDTVIRSLPQIAEAHPGVRFVVVGEGEDRDRLEKLSEQVAVRNRVEFTGAVEDDRLMDLYAQADVFVMPSAQEGFGLVFIEAMAFGTPVIGGDHGGTPDVVRSGETGFLVPFGDEEAIANRVIRLLSDDALRSRMGAEGVRDVQERFSFDTFARNVTEAVGEAERF